MYCLFLIYTVPTIQLSLSGSNHAILKRNGSDGIEVGLVFVPVDRCFKGVVLDTGIL